MRSNARLAAVRLPRNVAELGRLLELAKHGVDSLVALQNEAIRDLQC